mgnify:FL=1
MGKISKVNLKKVGFREQRNRYYARLEKFGGGRPLFKTEAEAARCYDSAEADIKNKTFVKVVNAKTFAECAGTYDKDYFRQTKKKIFVSGFLKKYQTQGHTKGRVQPSMVTDRSSHLENLMNVDYIDVADDLVGKVPLKKIGNVKMADFESLDLEKSLNVWFHNNKKIGSTSTRDKYMQSLKMVFYWAIKQKILKFDVSKYIDLEEMDFEEPVKRRVPNSELDKIVEHIKSPKWQLMVETASQTGLRPGEIAGLHWNEIDFGGHNETGAVSVIYGRRKDGSLGSGKTGAARRVVPLCDDLKDALRRWQVSQPIEERSQGLVFPNSVGAVCDNTKWNQKIITPACEKAEVERITMYDLRHYYASTLIYETTAKDVEIQYWMGHHSVAFTQKVYGHWLNDPRRNRTIGAELSRAVGSRAKDLKIGMV